MKVLSEWLKVMLEEVARRREEAQRAGGQHPAEASHPSTSPVASGPTRGKP
ncbi:MAG: hypothetical protein ACO3LH_05380 [Steroidobacteraceae bacterium]